MSDGEFSPRVASGESYRSGSHANFDLYLFRQKKCKVAPSLQVMDMDKDR